MLPSFVGSRGGQVSQDGCPSDAQTDPGKARKMTKALKLSLANRLVPKQSKEQYHPSWLRKKEHGQVSLAIDLC